LETGLDLITFSGDKILGGPQAGFLCGKKIWVDRCRSNPMFRALRVDKMIYAATEATLMSYLQGQNQEIPVMRMISQTPKELRNQGNAWLERLQQLFPEEQWDLVVTQNYVGGGVAPMKELLSYAISLRPGK